MNKRLGVILSELEDCEVFADVGCDHGYVAREMLASGKCKFAVVSDISENCLLKAVDNLKGFEGKFLAVVSDGFEKLPPSDEASIAGMGGELIVSILKRADRLPEKLLLQPMKNADKVRRFLVGNGYEIKRDYTFKDGKFYDLIKAVKGEDEYSDEEYAFGRDNLKEKNAAFIERITCRKKILKESVGAMNGRDRETAAAEIKSIEEVLI